jgi:hypothetical protein
MGVTVDGVPAGALLGTLQPLATLTSRQYAPLSSGGRLRQYYI